MIKKSKIKEIILGIALLVLVLLVLDPFGFYMSNMMTASVLALLVICFIAFQVFIWKNNPSDERELSHEHLAGRWAYLIGTASLLVGIAVQSFNHNVDIWLVLALFLMITTKFFTSFYADRNL